MKAGEVLAIPFGGLDRVPPREIDRLREIFGQVTAERRPVESGVMKDRAAVIASAVIRIVCDALRDALRDNPPSPGARDKARAAVATYLRDEIADIERQARADRRFSD